ncbi:MAG: hypothetical protein H0W11_04100 [Gemmatimonadetes bacterium]|jgi:hypothetical protein|nr:hypothetical protein [Gemmatimonadota bacterium]MBA4158238.1 hypothetical protein [Gemmatimonadota bacterium]
MTSVQRSTPSAANLASFIVYVTVVLTAVLVLFPPFTSLNGIEHAFVLTGPEWSRGMGMLGEELGLRARIHWAALLVQLGAVWAIALGARWFLGRDGTGSGSSTGRAMDASTSACCSNEQPREDSTRYTPNR